MLVVWNSFLPPQFVRNRTSPRLFYLIRNPDFDGILSRFDGRQFEDGDELFWFIVRPGVTPFGFGVADKVKNLNIPPPDGFTAKHFMHRHGFAVRRLAGVQVQDYRF